MEIVKPTRTKLQFWHGSLDFWIQFLGLIFFGIGSFWVFIANPAPFDSISIWFFIVPIVGFLYLFGFHADQSLVSYGCFNRTSGFLELHRRKVLFDRDFQKIPLDEIDSVQFNTTIIEYQLFTLNLFSTRNIKFEWHNSNPVAAFLGFFTGKITLYQVSLISHRVGQIHLTCSETDILRSKRKLVKQISAWLERHRHQPQLARPISITSSPSQQTQQNRACEAIEERDREIDKWQLAVDTDPNNAEAHYQLGIALYRNKKRQEASFHLKRARDLLTALGDRQKAAQIQDYLWQFGLD